MRRIRQDRVVGDVHEPLGSALAARDRLRDRLRMIGEQPLERNAALLQIRLRRDELPPGLYDRRDEGKIRL